MAGPFELQIAAFAERAMKNADLVVRKVGLDILTKVVMRSPVGNPDLWEHPAHPGYVGGRFRGNWQVSIGAPSTGTLAAIDRAGNATIARAEEALREPVVGRVVFIVNNLPYAHALEFGHSKQAPGGMVGLTVLEYLSIVDNAAAVVNQTLVRAGAVF